MKDEVIRILKLVEGGKIKAEDAARLLDAMGEAMATPKPGKFIKIIVQSANGDNVNITLPIGLIKMISNFIPKDAKSVIDEYEIDLNTIISAIQEGANGTLVDVTSSEGDIIKIVVE